MRKPEYRETWKIFDEFPKDLRELCYEHKGLAEALAFLWLNRPVHATYDDLRLKANELIEVNKLVAGPRSRKNPRKTLRKGRSIFISDVSKQ